MLDDQLLNIVSQKLYEYDFPHSNALLYKDLTLDKKASIDKLFRLHNVNSPLVFYSLIDNGWLVISSNEIIIQSNSYFAIICFEKIVRIKSDRNEKVNKATYTKDLAFELTNWIIVDTDKKEYLISIDKGKIWGSFFHLMQKILRYKGYWQ